MTCCAALPTARLERLLAEHVDTLSYRLDAWQTGLFDQRLRALRTGTATAAAAAGLFLGAVGYLRECPPRKDRRSKVEETAILPPELREGRGNLFVTPKGGGYVHTPSLNHATAAAMLRNGYLTHATPNEPGSARGQSLVAPGAARQATDRRHPQRSAHRSAARHPVRARAARWTTKPIGAVMLNDLKPAFRKAFPIRRTRIPRPATLAPHPRSCRTIPSSTASTSPIRPTTFPAACQNFRPFRRQQIDALRAERLAVKDAWRS